MRTFMIPPGESAMAADLTGAHERGMRRQWTVAAPALLLSLLCSVFLAGATRPPGFFPKYLEALRAPETIQADRLLDYSPLYLMMTRVLAPVGTAGILWTQCLLHALTAVAVALAVARLAPTGWALAAGLLTASYRPFLVYCGVGEPEIAIVASLSLAVLWGISARLRLARQEPDRWFWGAVIGAFSAVAAAGILRPQYLLLLPAWAVWIATAGAGSVRPRIWLVAGCVSAIIVAPVAISRREVSGLPMIMNPGPVFYEGNAPAATGLTRHAPELVRFLEEAHPEQFDYGHVAYRRIASASLHREVGVQGANRFWTRLAFEGFGEFPKEATVRFASKAIMALMPYEGHDLVISEDLDRRLRRPVPWGFGLLLVALPCLMLARRETLAALGGPVSIAVLSLLVQIVFYASARQRLPMALALLVIGPVLGAECRAERLRRRVRPQLVLAGGIAFSALVGFMTAPLAISDQLNWDRAMGPGAPRAGAWPARLLDGRLLRLGAQEDAQRLDAAVALIRGRHFREGSERIAPLCGRRLDFTVTDVAIGVPDYWQAVAQLGMGDGADAALSSRQAAATRPGEPRIAALEFLLREGGVAPAVAADWRPPGCDPVSAKWILSSTGAAAAGKAAPGRMLLEPFAARFPELFPPPHGRD